MHFRAFKSKTHMYRLYCNNNYCVIFLCYAICSTLEIMHKFINNYDIIGQNVGQIRVKNFWDKIRNYWDNCPSS